MPLIVYKLSLFCSLYRGFFLFYVQSLKLFIFLGYCPVLCLVIQGGSYYNLKYLILHFWKILGMKTTWRIRDQFRFVCKVYRWMEERKDAETIIYAIT
jgi:hypothetical protein